MVREIMHNEAFLAQKAEPAAPEDLPVAQDLLDTLVAMTAENGQFQVEKVTIPHESK